MSARDDPTVTAAPGTRWPIASAGDAYGWPTVRRYSRSMHGNDAAWRNHPAYAYAAVGPRPGVLRRIKAWLFAWRHNRALRRAGYTEPAPF